MNGLPLSQNELKFWFVDGLDLSETVAAWVARSVAILILVASLADLSEIQIPSAIRAPPNTPPTHVFENSLCESLKCKYMPISNATRYWRGRGTFAHFKLLI